jgi:hypothetical protein
LLTNMGAADEACRLYAKRFCIETFLIPTDFVVHSL